MRAKCHCYPHRRPRRRWPALRTAMGRQCLKRLSLIVDAGASLVFQAARFPHHHRHHRRRRRDHRGTPRSRPPHPHRLSYCQWANTTAGTVKPVKPAAEIVLTAGSALVGGSERTTRVGRAEVRVTVGVPRTMLASTSRLCWQLAVPRTRLASTSQLYWQLSDLGRRRRRRHRHCHHKPTSRSRHRRLRLTLCRRFLYTFCHRRPVSLAVPRSMPEVVVGLAMGADISTTAVANRMPVMVATGVTRAQLASSSPLCSRLHHRRHRRHRRCHHQRTSSSRPRRFHLTLHRRCRCNRRLCLRCRHRPCLCQQPTRHRRS